MGHTQQNYGFLKDPLIVNSLFLKKPERIEALGLVLLLALLLWRLVERSLRVHVETTGQPLTGWDKKATQKPTAFMLMTKFAGVMVIKVEGQRQLAHPLSTVQQQYLRGTACPLPPPSPLPKVDNETMRAMAGANSSLASRGGGIQKEGKRSLWGG